MRGLTSKGSTSRRSKSKCSFCRSTEHQVGVCPHVPVVWAQLEKGIIPLDYMEKPTSGALKYYTQGKYWGDLFKMAEASYSKWVRAQERERNKGKKRARTVAQSCGYCKETGHTRRSCPHQSHQIAQLKKANRNFRQWFYNEYVEKQGLSTGAVIEFDFKEASRWQSPGKTTTIRSLVTAINWDTINLFTLLDTKSAIKSLGWGTEIDGAKQEKMSNIGRFLQSPILCKVPDSAFSECNVNRGYGIPSDASYAVKVPMRTPIQSEDNVLHWYEQQTAVRQWGDDNITSAFKVVSRAPQTLAADWVDGYSDEMSVIFKKFTKAQLEYYGVQALIEKWADKEV